MEDTENMEENESEKFATLTFKLPKDLRKKLRMIAIEKEETISDMMVRIIQKEIGKKS